MLPRAHGSGLFTRGQTQALSVLTLGALGDYQLIDGLGPEVENVLCIIITFPFLCRRNWVRAPGRREIGHGAQVKEPYKILKTLYNCK